MKLGFSKHTLFVLIYIHKEVVALNKGGHFSSLLTSAHKMLFNHSLRWAEKKFA